MASASYITIDGDSLDDALLFRATVTQELDCHSWCDLEYRQTPDKRFPSENLLGKDVSVYTVADDGATQKMFAGIVVESELEYEISGSQRALLRAVSRSYLLDLTPRRAYYFQETAQQVAQKLVSAAGLSLDGTLEGPQLSYVQLDESDFRFIQRLVDASEKWLRPTDSGVQVESAFQSGPQVAWRAEYGLVHFEIRGSLTTPKATGAHYDYRKMESRVAEDVRDEPTVYDAASRMVAAAKSQSAQLPAAYISGRDRLLGVNELDNRLKKEVRRSLGGTVMCRGVSRESQIRAGSEVTVKGSPDADGTYGVTRVVHSWTTAGYENDFVCTPAKRYTNPVGRPLQRFDSVVPARVVDNNDPQGIGRIQVQYYWQEDGHTCWTRAMTPHAGANRGILQLPEIGDEVWVMFEEGDPERARILGASWNGTQQPPRQEFWGGDVSANDIKRIVTKSGHRITFSDKADKNAMVLATPNHLKLSMLERSNETGDAMLSLHSDGDIFLNAPNGRIHFQSKYFSREAGVAEEPKDPQSPSSTPGTPLPTPAKASPPPTIEYKSSGKGGSTTVAVDNKNKKVYVKTKLQFTGPDATEDYARAAKKQIEETWSGKMKRGGEDYDVVVTVETEVSKESKTSNDADQIIVDRKTGRMSQTLYGNGPGYQTPEAATDTGRPRRIAHEYGHTLGLEDGYHDTPEGSKPIDPTKKNDIMSETWPDKDGNLPHPHQDQYEQILKNHGW